MGRVSIVMDMYRLQPHIPRIRSDTYSAGYTMLLCDV